MDKQKHYLTKLILLSALICLSLLFTQLLQAGLSQSIDRLNIHAGETFVLTLQIDEEIDDQPDLSFIPKEFTVVSNSQYQQSSYVNGRGTTIKGWKIKLSTLKTGKVTIPSISIGQLKSDPVELFIKDTSDRVDLGGKKKAIYLESDIETGNQDNSVYVQQQIIFTVRLFRAVNTHYARLSEPFAGDSIIEKLGEDVQFNKTINNTRYLVTERRYSIFPQNSGELKIGAVNFTADVNDPNQQNRNRFLNTTRPISVNSKERIITVKPQPANADNPWIPATSVVLADKWSTPTENLTVGEPITWTLLLTAQGLSEAQLPSIELPKINGLQWYPDTPQKERQVSEKGILSQRIEKLAVIPSKAGKITIPEIKINWWDVKTDTQKTASIPSRTFNIKPAIIDPSAPIKTQQMIGPVNTSQSVIDNTKVSLWKNISGGIFALWLITLLAYFLKKSPGTNSRKPSNKGNKESNLSENEKTSFSKLIQSISANRSMDIEKHLISWVNTFSDRKIYSVGDLLRNSIKLDKVIVDELKSLQQQRYAKDEEKNTNYQFNLNKNELVKIRNIFKPQNSSIDSNVIPALYS